MPWLVRITFNGNGPGTTQVFPGADNDVYRDWMRERVNKINRRIAKTGGRATFEYVENDDVREPRNR